MIQNTEWNLLIVRVFSFCILYSAFYILHLVIVIPEEGRHLIVDGFGEFDE